MDHSLAHRRVPRLLVLALLGLVVPVLPGAVPGASVADDDARQVLAATGFKGGVVVHLGCGDGALATALHASGRCLVQGLDPSAEQVENARRRAAATGIDGSVSFGRLAGERLPYVDGLVNLVVVDDPGGIPMPEILRVLAPRATACWREGAGWKTVVKPPSVGTDEWTHCLHDASGNAVARDRVLTPPRHLQWTDGPALTRSHEHTPSIAALVSSGGRIFYIADASPPASMRQPPQWHLQARDAHNGLALWQRPVASWWPHLALWTSGPRQLQRRLLAVGDRVYATLGYHAPLSALDAATGETVRVYAETAGAEEAIWHDGVLLVVVRGVTAERGSELEAWSDLAAQPDSPLRLRETMDPFLKRLRGVETAAPVSLLAIEADTGRVLWRKDGAEAAGISPLSLAADGGRVFLQKGNEVRCLDLKSGDPLWTAAAARLRLVCERAVVCVDKETATALAPATGRPIWSEGLLLSDVRDAFVIGDRLWLGGFKPFDTGKRHTGPAWGPYFVVGRDLASGKVVAQIEPENPGHHHRCYANRATERYILGGRRGTEFIDLESGEVLWHNWARGVCMYGVMPANGLLYVPPHACACYPAARLMGFNALAGDRQAETPAASAGTTAAREEGPAFAIASRLAAESGAADDWPAYRHDAERSGRTAASVPMPRRNLWRTAAGSRITPPVAARGKVFVADAETHRLLALDAADGQVAWQFTAEARLDAPPALAGGLAVFGSHDGHLYAVNADDGALAWRLRLAREDRRIVASGRIAAASPVIGGVLVRDGIAYAVAGRSSYLDGGLDLCRVDVPTGRLLSRTTVYSPDPETGRQPPQSGPASVPGARPDVLCADARFVYLRDLVFDLDGNSQPAGQPHLLTLTSFLDDTWAHRAYWIFGTQCSVATGCSGRAKDLVYGRLLAVDDARVLGYGRQGVHWSNQLEDGPYQLFAWDRASAAHAWRTALPIQVRAMVWAGDVLFAAGAPEAPAPAADQPATAWLLAVAAGNGEELARHPLDALPAFDGLAAASGRLFLSTAGGDVICLAAD